MQCGRERGSEEAEDDDRPVRNANHLPVVGSGVDVRPVDVEGEDARDGDQLCRRRARHAHEHDQKQCEGAPFPGDGHHGVREDVARIDLACRHFLEAVSKRPPGSSGGNVPLGKSGIWACSPVQLQRDQLSYRPEQA